LGAPGHYDQYKIEVDTLRNIVQQYSKEPNIHKGADPILAIIEIHGFILQVTQNYRNRPALSVTFTMGQFKQFHRFITDKADILFQNTYIFDIKLNGQHGWTLENDFSKDEESNTMLSTQELAMKWLDMLTAPLNQQAKAVTTV